MDIDSICFLVVGFVWLLLAVVMFARFPSGSLAALFIVVYLSPVRCFHTALPWLMICCVVVLFLGWWDPFLCNILFSVYFLGWASCIVPFWTFCHWESSTLFVYNWVISCSRHVLPSWSSDSSLIAGVMPLFPLWF